MKRAEEQRDGEQAHNGNSPFNRRGEEKDFGGLQEATFPSVKFRMYLGLGSQRSVPFFFSGTSAGM
jgi:hypothetical protein